MRKWADQASYQDLPSVARSVRSRQSACVRAVAQSPSPSRTPPARRQRHAVWRAFSAAPRMQRGLCSRASATAPASSVPKAAAWPAFSFPAALPPLCRRRRERVIYPRPLVGRPDETKARRNALLAVVGCRPPPVQQPSSGEEEDGNENAVLFSAGHLRALPAKLNGGRLCCLFIVFLRFPPLLRFFVPEVVISSADYAGGE